MNVFNPDECLDYLFHVQNRQLVEEEMTKTLAEVAQSLENKLEDEKRRMGTQLQVFFFLFSFFLNISVFLVRFIGFFLLFFSFSTETTKKKEKKVEEVLDRREGEMGDQLQEMLEEHEGR
jgi:ABC-type multidrug transport system fused ATPase/permease subunit